MPIRVRLTLLAALGAIVLTSVGGWVFVHQLRNGLHTSVDSSLRMRADALVQKGAGDAQGGGIDFQDAGTTKLLNAREAIAQIVAPDGRVVESSEAAGTRPLLPFGVLRAARSRTVYYEGHVPGDRNSDPVPGDSGHATRRAIDRRRRHLAGGSRSGRRAACAPASSSVARSRSRSQSEAHGSSARSRCGRSNACADKPRRSPNTTQRHASRSRPLTTRSRSSATP